MRKINFILLISASITFLICIAFYLVLPSNILRYLITGSFTWIVYWVGWLLGYSCRSSEEKAKNKPRLYLPLEKEGEDHSLDALEYAKKVCDNEEQSNCDFAQQLNNAHFMVIRGGRENGKSQMMFPTPIGCEKDKKVCKKCVNCKNYISKIMDSNGESYSCSFCKWGNADIVRNVNWFTSCKHFEAKKR